MRPDGLRMPKDISRPDPLDVVTSYDLKRNMGWSGDSEIGSENAESSPPCLTVGEWRRESGKMVVEARGPQLPSGGASTAMLVLFSPYIRHTRMTVPTYRSYLPSWS